MQARTCLALLVVLPAIALAEDLGCGGDNELAQTYVEFWQAADLRQQELLNQRSVPGRSTATPTATSWTVSASSSWG